MAKLKKNRAFDHRHYADWRDPADLIPYEQNAKIHSEKQIRNIAASLRRFGWQQDCVITRDGVLVIGHGRRLAAMQLGCQIPVHVIDRDAEDLTEKDIRELRLADNQTNAETGWDWETLQLELDDLDFEDFDFDFSPEKDLQQAADSWFNREEKDGEARQEGNAEYNEFLEKFEQAKTTDDCYTPENIYQAVADYVAARYSVRKEDFIRPFFPGGDYQKHFYPENAVVVDNPPFSILSEILEFYRKQCIHYFLFAPGLVAMNYGRQPDVTVVCAHAAVTYENGAVVRTSFLTNMDGGRVVARSAPDLHDVIERKDAENRAEMNRQQPKYSFPDEVATASMLGFLSEHGQQLDILRRESVFIRHLDAMKEAGKGIYGGGSAAFRPAGGAEGLRGKSRRGGGGAADEGAPHAGDGDGRRHH